MTLFLILLVTLMIIACVKHGLVGLKFFLKNESLGDKAQGSRLSGNNNSYCRTWDENGKSAILELIFFFFLSSPKRAAIEMILNCKEASLYFCFTYNNLPSCLPPCLKLW